MPSREPQPATRSPKGRGRISIDHRWLVPAAVFVAAFAVLSSTGGSPGALLGPLAAASVLVPAVLVVLVLHAASAGLGRLVPLPRRCGRSIGARHAGGLGVLLLLMQIAGSAGLIGTGPVSVGVIWGVVVAGLVLAAVDPRVRRVFRSSRSDGVSARPRLSSPVWFVGSSCVAVAGAVVCVAAASPPGWLWRSEYAGFDALSYHLPVAQEWLAAGRVAPLEHVVYAALPSGMEVSFAWLAPLTLSGPGGLLAGDGWRLVLTQVWHASFLVPLAWGVRSAVRVHTAGGADLVLRRVASLAAAAVAVATPWAIVTGTLAYNDLAAAAFVAAGLAAALRGTGGRVCVRDAIALGAGLGVLTGAAAVCKPTALLLTGPAVGVTAFVGIARARGARLARVSGFLSAGCVVGLIMLAPWLGRNWAEAGNPFFPFVTDVFGSWHWSAEQAARWGAGHTASRGLVDRLSMLVLPDATADPAAATVARFRGATNPQWGVLWFAAAVSLAWLAVVRARTAAAIGGGLALGVLAWAALTHVQSRFLIPLIGPLAVAVGVGLAARRSGGTQAARTSASIRSGVAIVIVVVQTVVLVATFYTAGSPTRGTGPNEVLFGGVPLMRGEFAVMEEGGGPLSPVAFVRSRLVRGDRLYLLGDAKPLYVAPGGEPMGPAAIEWHTVWDTGGLDAVGRWAAAADWIVVDYSELARYAAIGYADPGVTPERVRALIEGLARPQAAFAGGRIVVYRRARTD